MWICDNVFLHKTKDVIWYNHPTSNITLVVQIHIVIQHTSLTYHTHIHTQTHDMDESIHKFPHHPLPIWPHNQRARSQNPSHLNSLSENVTRNIYYHKTHDANTYSQAKPTPLRESMSMLTWHHSLELH